LKDNEIESTPDVSNSASSIFILGIANIDDVLHILVSLDKLLNEQDLALLAK